VRTATEGHIDGAAVPRLVSGLVARPRLFELLDRGAAAPVTLLSAPAGSGKTMLMASWLRSAELPGPVAWVGVERGSSDATRFWGMVMDGLRASGAIADDDALATLAPAPLGGQDEFLARLVDGLGGLPRTVLLVIDDLHELHSEEGLRSLDRLLERAPEQLHTFIVTRRDPPLSLHRLRLSGELVEIRAADLEFTVEEAAQMMDGAGVQVADGDLGRLHERTEGWAAALRLAAMSLARHEQPDRFVAEFAGSERTVADYLVGEVLSSQPPEVRELLVRTCILDRVNGPLADLLTGRRNGTRLLSELEDANALVVAVDVARSWFRYHHLLVDLLRLELQRSAPDDVPGLHRLAAGWYAEHGHAVEAIRHAELGGDWELAADLLGRNWVSLVLDGEEATLASLLEGLPAGFVEGDAEIATIAAAGRLGESRWTEADALLAAADRALGDLPEARRDRATSALAAVRLLRARRLGDFEGMLQGPAALPRTDAGDGSAGVELKALALMNLGIAENWTLRLADAEAHLEEALALGREIGRPYVEVGCLGGLGVIASMTQRLDVAEDRLRRAIAVAERVGWSSNPIVAAAYVTLAVICVDRGSFAEGEGLLARAEPILADAPEPAATVGMRHGQGLLAFGRGRHAAALDAFREGERMTELLRAPHFLLGVLRQWQYRAQLRLGDPEPARAALAEASEEESRAATWRNLDARVRLTDGDPAGAADAVAPVLAGETFVFQQNFEIEACVLDALARSQLEQYDAAARSTERALELTEPNGRVCMVLTIPGARELFEGHPAHSTAHGAWLQTLLDHLSGAEPAPAAAEASSELLEPLTERELAVLRFLPTNLSAGDIGSELFLSVHTVKTHMRKLYAKLDVHTRAEAVQRGRALGLLAQPLRSV
jgi:LuxR family transcriptional regulator, maltose regulon positive regulatory protein